MDNNPVVCADRFAVPGSLATLGLIALGPLVRSGLILEPPVVISNADDEARELDAALEMLGWSAGCETRLELINLDGILACTALAVISSPETSIELDELYDEAYSRSFFVRREDDAEWHTRLVRGAPHAAYQLRYAPDEPASLVTIRVMSDPHGKVGEAQLVHALNVMAGFEESLGQS